jgi:hypothetical protein
MRHAMPKAATALRSGAASGCSRSSHYCLQQSAHLSMMRRKAVDRGSPCSPVRLHRRPSASPVRRLHDGPMNWWHLEPHRPPPADCDQRIRQESHEATRRCCGRPTRLHCCELPLNQPASEEAAAAACSALSKQWLCLPCQHRRSRHPLELLQLAQSHAVLWLLRILPSRVQHCCEGPHHCRWPYRSLQLFQFRAAFDEAADANPWPCHSGCETSGRVVEATDAT